MNSFFGKTFLVVDDEEDLCDILSMILKFEGANVITANNVNDAFKVVKENQIDVVISDIRMPNGSGIELLDKIKKFNPDSPAVVLMTGDSAISEESVKSKGALALHQKPMDYKKIIDLICKKI